MITDLTSARENFIVDLKKKGRSTSTILAYNKDVDQLIQFSAKQKISQPQELTFTVIEAFKTSLTGDIYTAKSVSRKLNSIKTFCRFLVSLGLIKDNPAAGVTHPKYEIKPPRILSKMEYRSLRDVCREDIRLYAIVEILLQTGIRISELANLKLEDIDTDKLDIKPFESHSRREVPLNKVAQAALSSYLKIRPNARVKQVFITKTGRPFLIRNIRTAIDRYFKIAGVKNAKVNDLRHTFIAHQLASGTPLTLISKLAGHKRLSTTEKYLEFITKPTASPAKLEEL
ncbi:MAG: tyrosine-type recombinase/integrase [Candidatus Beckwithbacteria bacterium]|nr:tyrosine-type recombinase/integrase [Candidatus Beckwithbacteria bacterium]